MAAAVTGVLIVYYVWGVRRTDFAGRSFGTRHLVPIVPFCYFFAVVAWSRLRAIIWRAAFVLLGLVSLIYACEGARDPWERIEMLVRQGSPNLAVLQKIVAYPWSRYDR